jgi:hypothetical protein
LNRYNSKGDPVSNPKFLNTLHLLSAKNISSLEANHCQYILGARIKNENKDVKGKISSFNLNEGQSAGRRLNDSRVMYSHVYLHDVFTASLGYMPFDKPWSTREAM